MLNLLTSLYEVVRALLWEQKQREAYKNLLASALFAEVSDVQ